MVLTVGDDNCSPQCVDHQFMFAEDDLWPKSGLSAHLEWDEELVVKSVDSAVMLHGFKS